MLVVCVNLISLSSLSSALNLRLIFVVCIFLDAQPIWSWHAANLPLRDVLANLARFRLEDDSCISNTKPRV